MFKPHVLFTLFVLSLLWTPRVYAQSEEEESIFFEYGFGTNVPFKKLEESFYYAQPGRDYSLKLGEYMIPSKLGYYVKLNFTQFNTDESAYEADLIKENPSRTYSDVFVENSKMVNYTVGFFYQIDWKEKWHIRPHAGFSLASLLYYRDSYFVATENGIDVAYTDSRNTGRSSRKGQSGIYAFEVATGITRDLSKKWYIGLFGTYFQGDRRERHNERRADGSLDRPIRLNENGGKLTKLSYLQIQFKIGLSAF